MVVPGPLTQRPVGLVLWLVAVVKAIFSQPHKAPKGKVLRGGLAEAVP